MSSFSLLEAVFPCPLQGKYIVVHSSTAYPDGDLIDIYVEESLEGIVVSDLGETRRWVTSQTLSSCDLPVLSVLCQQDKLIESVQELIKICEDGAAKYKENDIQRKIAFEKGVDAYHDEKGYSENPFKVHSVEWNAWLEGMRFEESRDHGDNLPDRKKRK